MDNNIIEKEDNAQRVFLSEDIIDVVEILKDYYGYIYESMQDEKFILKYDQCNLFKELLFENKVVGFCTYDFSRQFITASLNNIYVLPEYRGNNIFKKELIKTMEDHHKPSIMEPTRLVVELLIRYGFAKKINDDIVASAIEFVIPGSHVESNTVYDNEELATHFYDLKSCRSIHILDLNKGYIAYSSPLNYDIIHYDCMNVIDESYLNGIVEFFKNNDVDLMKTILDLEDMLPIKNYTLEEVIGDDNSLSFYIETLIDDSHVTYDKALQIKQQIREEYESGMILNESLLIRLAYLFNENPEVTIKSHEETCPYCDMPIDDHDKYCHFCGINLSFDADDLQNNLIQSLNTSGSEFREDIRFIAFKFLKLISEKIDLDYSIFTIENNYDVAWSQLKHFLDKNNYFRDGQITDDGLDFMKSHPLYFWERYQMQIVDYTDFENYFYKNSGLNPYEICLNYLKQFGDDEYIMEIMDEVKRDFN